MITAFLLLLGIAVTVWAVAGILDGHKRPRRPIWSLHYMTALTGVIGGGIYGLGMFDSNFITPFSWAAFSIIVGGSWAFLWAIRRNREMDFELRYFIETMLEQGIGKENDKGD